jgi:hypothetical protein
MKPLVLTPAEQAEAIGNLVAVRQIGIDMAAVFSALGRKETVEAARGAERMVTAINRVLELLDAPPDLRRAKS